MNQYGFLENMSNLFSLIYTKMIFPRARLIRLPFYLRGKSAIEIGQGFTCGYACRFDLDTSHGKTLIIKNDVRFGDNVHIVAHDRIEIGDNCLFASKIFISDTSHGDMKNPDMASNPTIPPAKRPLTTSPVILGKNIWVGENVTILMGCSIGDGCIIGANSVVTRSIPSNSMAVGSPARVIKTYDFSQCLWTNSISSKGASK